MRKAADRNCRLRSRSTLPTTARINVTASVAVIRSMEILQSAIPLRYIAVQALAVMCTDFSRSRRTLRLSNTGRPINAVTGACEPTCRRTLAAFTAAGSR